MLEAIGTAFTQIISWIGSFVTALTSTSGALYALLPLFAIGIGISIVLVCVKLVRKIVWGA